MSQITVSVVENNPSIVVSNDVVEINITESVVDISTAITGPQGASYDFGDPIYVKVTNKTGATMPKGTIVYTSGAVGNHVTVAPALADADVTSSRALGWLSTAVANNADGFAIVEGYLNGIDTDHIPEGSQLYLSPTVAGGFTATKPIAPDHMVYVGVLGKSNPGNGQVYVKIQNGYELDELHDVQIISPTDNQVLTYESATGLWKNKVNPADGVTSITATSPLTGGTITSTGSIGLDQTALSITQSQVSNLVSDLAGKANLAGGNAFTGSQTITSTAAGEFPLSIISASGQTASTFRVRNSANNADLMSIDSSGQIRTPTLLNPNSFNNSRLQMQNTGVFIDTGITTNVPLAVRGASGQTENLQVWQSNAGSNLARISQNGSIGTNANLSVGNTGITNTNQFQVTATAATQIGAVIRGAASQSADLLQLQNSSGTILWKTDQNGFTTVGTNTVLSNALLSIAPYGVTQVGAIIRGASGQTADLQQWQTWNGTTATTVTKVDKNGAVSATYFGPSGTGLTGYLEWITSTPTFYSGAAATVGMIIKGASGQTADLTQWQNNTGGVVAWVQSNGSIFSGANATFGSATSLARLTAIVGTPTNIGAVIRGAATQSADLLQLQNSAGSILAKIDSLGDVYARVSRSTFAARFTTTDPSIAVQVNTGAASQTGDVIQIQASTGTVLGGSNANGQIYTGSTTPSTYAVGGTPAGASGTGSIATITFSAPTNLAVGDLIQVTGFTTAVGTYNTTGFAVVTAVSNTPTFFVSYASTGVGTPSVIGQVSTVPQSSVVARSAGTIGQVVRGTLGQTADVFQIQRFDGVPFVVANASYQMGFGSRVTIGTTAISTAGLMTVIAQLATQIPAVIRGAASQTANLLELQNSAGTIQASIDSSGMASLLRGNFRGAVYGTGTYFGAVNVLQESGGHGVVVQGRDSQTTDLLRIRMGATPGAGNDALMVQSSAGATLARIDSGGNLKASNVATINSLAQLAQANSGGVMIMGRATAQFSSPGANSAALYFRDGTNAGTLKLVVRAGAAGAETTILDNIPQ